MPFISKASQSSVLAPLLFSSEEEKSGAQLSESSAEDKSNLPLAFIISECALFCGSFF